MKEYLTIGELANIFQMSVQLLRHYDAHKLLVPAVRNNSRRLYHFNQIYQLATIRYLRRLGYSLDEIKEFIATDNLSQNLNRMIHQTAILQQKCDDLTKTIQIIQKKLAFIEREKKFTTREKIYIREYPDRQFIPIGDELTLFTHELFYFYPTVGFYQGGKKWFGAYLFDEEDSVTTTHKGAETATIPGGRYLCGYHYGPYQTIQDSIDKLYKAGTQYKLDSCVVTLNIIDQFVEGNTLNYITALEVRINE